MTEQEFWKIYKEEKKGFPILRRKGSRRVFIAFNIYIEISPSENIEILGLHTPKVAAYQGEALCTHYAPTKKSEPYKDHIREASIETAFKAKYGRNALCHHPGLAYTLGPSVSDMPPIAVIELSDLEFTGAYYKRAYYQLLKD